MSAEHEDPAQKVYWARCNGRCRREAAFDKPTAGWVCYECTMGPTTYTWYERMKNGDYGD